MPTSTMNQENIIRSIYDYPTNGIKTTGASYDPSTGADKTLNIGGNLVPDKYDNIALTYVASGNGAGQIHTATYSLMGSQVALLTLIYDNQNRISNVART